jgi:GNAT superfamily N-acetyltransferase
MEQVIERITFAHILPIWRDYLWPNRVSKIEPVSVMRFLGGIDMAIQNNTPTFFGAFVNGHLVGVNSGIKTASGLYRSRGIYVLPAHRGHNIAQDLFKATEQQAKDEDCAGLWSMPREPAFPTYQRFGFVQVSRWFEEETGVNCYVVKQVSK